MRIFVDRTLVTFPYTDKKGNIIEYKVSFKNPMQLTTYQIKRSVIESVFEYFKTDEFNQELNEDMTLIDILQKIPMNIWLKHNIEPDW